MNKIKYIRYSVWILAVFTVVFSFWGFFKVGILSDTFGDAFTAVNSGTLDKITNNIPFIDPNRYRPLLFLSLRAVVGQNILFNIPYDNFIIYKIVSLVLYLSFAFASGFLVFKITGDLLKAVITEVLVLVFPNNLHNLFWTAAYFELLCGIFCLLSLVYAVKFISEENKKYVVYSDLFLFLALLTKEISVPIPFITVLIVLMYYGYKTILKNKTLFISQAAVLVLYFTSKTFLSKGIPVISSEYFGYGFFYASAEIIVKALVSLLIPGDYLVLKTGLREFSFYILLYLLLILIFVAYYSYRFIKEKKAKQIIFIAVILSLSVSPYVYAGYIRPQLILIPFAFIIVAVISVFNIKENLLKYFLLIFIMFWIASGYGILNTWKTAYSKGKDRVDNLIKSGIPSGSVVIGNPARLQQSFMFDNIMFAYNYFKYREFVIKDIISDKIRTVALDENSLDAKIEITEISKLEYDLKCTGKTQFFYLDGDDKKIKSDKGFKNDFMSAEYLEFNELNKPVKLKVKFYSDNIICYVFQGNNPERLK